MTRARRQPIADDVEAAHTPPGAAPVRTPRRDQATEMAPGDLAGRRWRWLVAMWSKPGVRDATACLGYTLFALWLTSGLWPDPATRAIAENVNDQALIEWFLAHGVLFWTGDFGLVTDRLNSPDGVNLMSNASHILHGVIMAPVTAALGVAVSFALLVALNLAATAAGWYLLLARGLGLHRAAAVIGGAFAGFAPGMISQSNSHLHMTAQWLVPPIVWFVIKLTRVTTGRSTSLTAGALAALVCAQLMLGEEVLYLAALTIGIFALAYALCRRAWAGKVGRHFLAGMATATGISTVVLAYPLAIQFAGDQHTPNAPFGPHFFYADVASYGVFSPLSLAGSESAGRLATSAAEYNTYLGLPLLLVLLGCVIWLRRSPVIVATVVTGAVMALLSFGPNVTFNRQQTGLPAPYALIADVPVINGALPTRYALALIPLVSVALAYAVSAALRSSGFVRLAVPVAVVMALIPIAPKPLPATDRAPVPSFITSGAWRECMPEGGVLVPVPLPSPQNPDLMRWPAAANVAFAIPEGFFIGPYGPGGKSSIGTYPRPTSQMLAAVARTGNMPEISDATRAQAQADLAFWRADCVALAPGPQEAPLRATLEQLLGPGTEIAGTWTWRVAR